jgi:hypothetical protein
LAFNAAGTAYCKTFVKLQARLRVLAETVPLEHVCIVDIFPFVGHCQLGNVAAACPAPHAALVAGRQLPQFYELMLHQARRLLSLCAPVYLLAGQGPRLAFALALEDARENGDIEMHDLSREVGLPATLARRTNGPGQGLCSAFTVQRHPSVASTLESDQRMHFIRACFDASVRLPKIPSNAPDLVRQADSRGSAAADQTDRAQVGLVLAFRLLELHFSLDRSNFDAGSVGSSRRPSTVHLDP